MRAIRLTLFALILSLTAAACTSPTAYDDDCVQTGTCEDGHPDSGN